MRRAGLTLAVALVALAVPAGATAKDPGRWRLTATHSVPPSYWQGMTTGRGHFFFAGFDVGLWRTDTRLHQTAGVADEIPASVAAADHYNHIGDPGFDPTGAGRVLLPMECYDASASPSNCAGTGAIGVADPGTLAWRYYVKLDPAYIKKAMWCEVSPDRKLLWTSSGSDLLAYRLKDISPAHAAPGGTPLKPAKVLAGAVPPSGVTGAVFYGGRLLLAGSIGTKYQVWAVDLKTKGADLQIERRIVGESEGLGAIDALGGVLHWLVMPIPGAHEPATYAKPTLLSFFPHVTPRATFRPRRLTAGRRTTLRVRVTVRILGRAKPLAGATVRLLGKRARTGRDGRAKLIVRPGHAGRFTVRIAWHGDHGTARIRAESKK